MNAPPKNVTMHFPEVRLTEIISKRGGKTYSSALTAAKLEIAPLHDAGVAEIVTLLQEAENIVAGADSGTLSSAQVREIQDCADSIITVAGTFEFQQLDAVARSLGDLTNIFLDAGIGPTGPIAVHIQSARLFVPPATRLPDDQAKVVFGELQRVLKHFGEA